MSAATPGPTGEARTGAHTGEATGDQAPAGRVRVDPTRMMRRLAGIVLGCEVPVLIFAAVMAWGLGNADGALGVPYLTGGLVLVVLCIAALATLRRPLGMWLGWLVQFLVVASALVVTPMIVVGLIFGALWVVAVVQGRKMDALTADYVRRHGL